MDNCNTSQLELILKARNLCKRNEEKHDPQCMVLIQKRGDKKAIEIGRTEVVRNCRSPQWSVKIPVKFVFNETQKLTFQVWDYDIIADNELLGETEMNLAAIINAKNKPVKKRLKQKVNDEYLVVGELQIDFEETQAAKQTAIMQFKAQNLVRKDFLGRSDPYLMISKEVADSEYTIVYKSEVLTNTLNPNWKAFASNVQTLCDGNCSKALRLELFDWDRHLHDDFIGSCLTTFSQLQKGPGDHNTYNCFDMPRLNLAKRKSMAKVKGVIKLTSFAIRNDITFIDYVRSGTQIHYAVAIDFTFESQWYHFVDKINDKKLNLFETVMKSTCDILKDYDYQGLYSGFGFGAKVMPNKVLAHDFELDIGSISSYFDSVDHIINSYRKVMRLIEPTEQKHFSKVINRVSSIAKNFQDGKHYFILTILTSGPCHDMSDTLEAIVNSSSRPLSIIIVHIGNKSIGNVEYADGDAITSRGKRTWRNNLQSIELHNYLNTMEVQDFQDKIGKIILAKIPQQFLEFMKIRSYSPQLASKQT